MSGPYTALPDAAHDVCRSQAEKGFVWDLYKESRHRRWSQLPRQSLRSLADRYSLTKERVQRVLSELHDEDLIVVEVEMRGKRRDAMTIRVHDPMAKSQYRHAARHAARHERDTEAQEEPGSNGTSATRTRHAARHAARHEPPDSAASNTVPPVPQNPEPGSLIPEEEQGSVSAEADTPLFPDSVDVRKDPKTGFTVITTDPGRRRRGEKGTAPRAAQPTAAGPTAPRGIASGLPPELDAIGSDIATETTVARPAPGPAAAEVPKWARSRDFRREDGPPAERMRLIHRAVETIRAKSVDPMRMATNAKPVIALWKALERPPLAEFIDELVLVAEAAHQCPDKLFARDIRGEGWADGRDRSRDVTTICVQSRWDTRLDAAQAWDSAGRPGRGGGGFDPADPQAPFKANRAAILAEQARKYGGAS